MAYDTEEAKIWEKQNIKKVEEEINKKSMAYDDKKENNTFPHPKG
jgi:hypothetical protein